MGLHQPIGVQPQTKKVANSTQKMETRAQSRSVTSGDISNDVSPAPAAGIGDIAFRHKAADRDRSAGRACNSSAMIAVIAKRETTTSAMRSP